MPTVFVWKGLRFFYSNERNEPPHVHIRGWDAEGKIWLSDLSIARNRGFAARDLKDNIQQIDLHRQQLLDAWSAHFGH